MGEYHSASAGPMTSHRRHCILPVPLLLMLPVQYWWWMAAGWQVNIDLPVDRVE